jgi:hypothetical protein
MDWKTMLAYVTGSVDEELLRRNEYLAAENRILRAHIPDNQLLNLLIHAGPPRIGSLLRAIELLGDQPPVPGQDCLGPDDARDLREGFAAEPLANLRQRPALSVAQVHAAMRS